MSDSRLFGSFSRRGMSVEELEQAKQRRKVIRAQITAAVRAAKLAPHARLLQAKVHDRTSASAMRRMFTEEKKLLKGNSTVKRAARKPRVYRHGRQPERVSAQLDVSTLDLPSYEVYAMAEPKAARASPRVQRSGRPDCSSSKAESSVERIPD